MKTPRGNFIFGALIAGLLGVGALMGYTLSGYTKLAPYKLLNIAGIMYGLIGVLVLSELVAKSNSLKSFMVHWVAGVLLWAHTVIPLGALIGAGIAYSRPSAGITARFFIAFFVYSIFVLIAVDEIVFFPRFRRFEVMTSRTQAFGLILLVSGLVVQLLAAIQDFNS